jgi:hypothetical protein
LEGVLFLLLVAIGPLGVWVYAASEAGTAAARVWRWTLLCWVPFLSILAALFVAAFVAPAMGWGFVFVAVFGGPLLLLVGLVVLADVKAAKRRFEQSVKDSAEERQ